MNGIPKGCKYCVKGEKLVLFVTGMCQRKCFYCSISDEKYEHDVIFANERPVKTDEDIIQEVIDNQAQGAGFTGGDPLARFERTLHYIKLLKDYDKNFHIHLYTIPESITKKRLEQLFNAGLDEIRLHPNLEDETYWFNIKMLKMFDWNYGLEIPSIPHLFNETMHLLNFSNGHIQFLNLNELEVADNEQSSFGNYHTKNPLSYAVKGSEETAFKIMKNCDPKLMVHYCTAKLKDSVQLKNRIKLRAEKIKNKFDKVTRDGILKRNVIYLYKPESKEIKQISLLTERLELSNVNDYILDEKNVRAFVSSNELKNPLLKKNHLIPAKVMEYPTYDNFLIEVDFV
jgi:pyruvate formate-lyase activating enzyme-like uncharacterized protein